MAQLVVISIEDGFCRSMLEQFKQYASVPDNSRDALLQQLLQSAVLRVQEFADRPIVRTKVQQTVTVPNGSGIVRLYMGGGDIESVTSEDGTELAFDPLPGGRLQLFRRSGTVTITFTTAPDEGEQARLLPTVFRYATALYDGEDSEVLNKILMETF